MMTPTDLPEVLLNKRLEDVEEDDLERLLALTGFEERIDLEFKAFDALSRSRDNIGKTVSAFANSVGGMLLIGAKDGHLDWGDASGWSLEKVENILLRKIYPRPTIRCHEVRSASDLSKVVYIAHVQRYAGSLVMYDNRYYHRSGTSSIPMEPYEVEQALNLRKQPDLELCLTKFQLGDGKGPGLAFRVYVCLLNSGTGAAHHPFLLMQLGPGIVVDDYGNLSYAGLRGSTQSAQWLGNQLVLPSGTGIVASELCLRLTGSTDSQGQADYYVGAEGIEPKHAHLVLPGDIKPLPRDVPLLVAPGVVLS